MTDKEYIEQLVNKLNKASDDYYNGHESMPDHEFDELLAELARKETETGIILPDSPTQHVGADSLIGEKIEHEYKMLSLPKSKKLTDVQKFALANGRDMWLSWKLDGNSVQVTWNKGRLQRIESRGTGEIGSNLTRFSKNSAIRGIPNVIPYKGKVVVRGEALIDLSDFEELKELNSEYKNSRNLCAGSLNLKDIEEVKKRRIHWTVYTLVYVDSDDDPNGIQLKTWGERADFMKNTLGLDVVEHEFVPFTNIGNAIDRWTKRVSTLDFPVDGLVFARNIHKRLDAKNETGKFYKDQAYAYKFTDECKETYIKDIVWNVNQNCITPVAVFSPIVELAGTKVEKSTLNNIDFCNSLGITKDAKVRVYKANMIIPQVLDVIEKGDDELNVPKVCPVCGAPTEVVESESGSHRLICTNPNCIAKKQKSFERFTSRNAMNIDSVGPSVISDFINKGWLRSFADFYHLKDHMLEISSMSGYGAKSARKIVDGVEKSRKTTGQRFLYSLSVPLCGIDVAKKLLSKYSFADLMDMLLSGTAKRTDFSKIDGIGDEKASALIKWFKNPDNNTAVRNLLKEVEVEDTKQDTGNKCEGLIFCITGSVHTFKNRDAFKSYVESQGGKVSGSVSRKLTALVNNDAQSTSSKNKKAHELNIPIITEDEFIERYGYEN